MENFKTTIVGMAGDWHCDTQWVIGALKAFKKAGITEVYHVGDFGFFTDREGEKFLRALERQLALYGITLYVTLGNHEDYVFIDGIPVAEDGMKWVTPHTAVMPRGYRWTVGDVSFVSLGGAPSIDFETRKQGISWWTEETLTMGDVYRIAEGGHADVMITHDAPNGIPHLSILEGVDESEEWSREALQYAAQGRELMTYAVNAVKPQVLFHGHYHEDYIEDGLLGDDDEPYVTKVVGLNRNRRRNNIMVFNVETSEMEWLELEKFFVPDMGSRLRV